MAPRFLWMLPVLFLIGAVSGGTAAAGALPVSADWALDPEWDDGLAEVAVYEAERRIYGAPRPYEAVLLTVKEDFDGEVLVKADPPYGGRSIVTVLKQNAVREIGTPNYDYRIMTSTFVRRDDPAQLVKLTSASHEWCGNTWKAIRNGDGGAVYDWSSYFDGEGDGSQELGIGPGDLLEDQLPLVLRGLEFRKGLSAEFRLLPTMATSHAGAASWLDATLGVSGRETVEVPAGTFTAWRLDVATARGTTSYWLDDRGTHALIRVDSSTGDSMRLKRIERRAYWQLP